MKKNKIENITQVDVTPSSTQPSPSSPSTNTVDASPEPTAPPQTMTPAQPEQQAPTASTRTSAHVKGICPGIFTLRINSVFSSCGFQFCVKVVRELHSERKNARDVA